MKSRVLPIISTVLILLNGLAYGGLAVMTKAASEMPVDNLECINNDGTSEVCNSATIDNVFNITGISSGLFVVLLIMSLIAVVLLIIAISKNLKAKSVHYLVSAILAILTGQWLAAVLLFVHYFKPAKAVDTASY